MTSLPVSNEGGMGKSSNVSDGEQSAATMTIPLERRINREWAQPNRYVNFPEPILVELESSFHSGWKYTRALCPVKYCTYNGLKHGFNQHYARKHAPEQWRQHAKRVIKVVNSSLAVR